MAMMDDDYASSEDARNLISAEKEETNKYYADLASKAEAPKKAGFKDAFAEARKAGEKTFEYMGKKYTTELESDKPAAKKAPERTQGKINRTAVAAAARNSMGGMKKGGSVSSASKRADGCCVKGKTRGKMV